jgi:DNA polymerase
MASSTLTNERTSEFATELALTLRSVYGDLLDLPLLEPHAAPLTSGKNAANPAVALAKIAEEARFCQRCALHIGRGKSVFGRGFPGARLAFLGDFPSDADDAKGEPLSDATGELLHKMILAMKIKPEETYLANVCKCRPPAGQLLDAGHFLACDAFLQRQFALVNAPFVVALGEFAARSLARSEAPLRVLRRQVFDWNGRKLVCTHHPRDLLQSPEKKKEAWEDLQLVMREMGAKK